MAKTPSTMSGLKALIEKFEADLPLDEKGINMAQAWLRYTYDTLRDRTVYHKKQQVRRKMLLKVAKEMLDKDELESIDRQAEELAERKLEVEDVLHGSTEEGPEDLDMEAHA